MKLPQKSKATEQPSVSKRRGRPRKQRRKRNETVTDESKISKPIALIGRYVSKKFSKNAVCIGKVVSYKIGIYRVEFEGGICEELTSSEIRKIMLEDFDLDHDLIRRKNELDESLMRKIVDESDKNPSELNVDEEEKNSSELNVDKEEEMLDTDADLSSDVETAVELPPQLELPPELMLPPSSGTIGVPESSVYDLFSVYTFLRSFSTRLFLSPFSLDEFVGALNCEVSNTLIDAVHNALMRALRRHLENLSAEGSKIASRCLRYSEWSLLDTLTWPVFLVQYLAVNGWTKGSEWKGFYDEIFHGEYYSLPASRKLKILQILCDDVLESEELRSEVNMREESEAGKNYDAEDIPHAEKGPKRVHRRCAKTADCQDEESMKFVSKLDDVNLPGNSEDEVDRNGDECRLCGMDGTLLCCDGCPAVYHSRCIGVMKMYISDGEWHCPECKINTIGPTIARGGTSLRGAEMFGNDLYGQSFIGTCDHLLVLSGNNGEVCRKYYNQHDIPEVIRVLCASIQHRPVYSGICMAMLQYWNISESFQHLCVPNGTHINSENSKIDEKISATLLPHVVENDHKGVSLGKAEYGLTSVNGVCSDNMAPFRALITSSPICETNGNTNKSSAAIPDLTGPGKSNDFVYRGYSYKQQAYVNTYMHGDFAASAAANLALLSSDDSRPEGHVSDLWKAASENTNLLAKAFSLTASRFFWPSSDKKLAEVIRERCGWCLSCKALVSSKKGCMLNHAAICATKSAMKILSGLAPVRSGEGISPTIATYVIYMEESLCGLIDGPFLSGNYRKQWREQVERATTFSNIKPLLLHLEENIRTIAFCGDWVKLADEWLVESPTIQSATSTLGTTQERAPCDRCRKLPIKYPFDTSPENFGWWNGKFTKSVFQKAALPKFMVRKAARQGGLRKILGIVYPEVSVIPKRSRQLFWRAAVEMSRNASQLALQVRYLDFHIRWIDLIQPECNLQDGKGQDTEIYAFRNAIVHDKKFAQGKTSYGIDFGSQKHIPSRIMKNAETIDEGPDGKKYWFSETFIPLYLVKDYEVRNIEEPSHKDNLNVASRWHKRRLNAICKDIFFYLTCKRDKTDMLSCSVCNQGVLFRNALKCSACQGYCHEGCSINSTFSTYKDVEFLITCKQCYHTRLLAQKETSYKSSTTPLLLKGREHGSSTILKKPEPKCDDQILRPTRVKDCCPDMKKVASQTPLETKSSSRKSSWGIIWRKNNSEDTGIDFRLKNIIMKRPRSSLPQLEPVCHLCHKPYNSDLMYIGCETCTRWYHAEALELEESKIFSMLGFKCCRCRKIKSPVCPYSDSMCKEQVVEKSHSRGSKRKNYGAESSGSGTLADTRAREPATHIFPIEDVSKQENSPLPFSLSNVELIAEPMSELDAGIEYNVVSGSGLQKIPEEESNGTFGGEVQHAEISTQDEMNNLPAEILPPFVELDSLFSDCDLLNDSETLDNEYMDFESETDFSLSELLNLDNNSQFEEADVPRDLSGFAKDSCTLGVPEERATTSIQNNQEPTISSHQNVHNCSQCSKTEPAPDLSCLICKMWIHSKCSPWIESPSRLGDWRCGNCREWQ